MGHHWRWGPQHESVPTTALSDAENGAELAENGVSGISGAVSGHPRKRLSGREAAERAVDTKIGLSAERRNSAAHAPLTCCGPHLNPHAEFRRWSMVRGYLAGYDRATYVWK